MNLDSALATFVAESGELLQQMEESLLRLEQMPDHADTINAIFRAAHTIKGSAGLFGLDDVVAFTHTAEIVLDKVRAGELKIDAELAAVLLNVCDHIGKLVDHVAGNTPIDGNTHRAGDELTACLQTCLGQPQKPAPVAASGITGRESRLQPEGGGAVESDNWHLSLRFNRDVLRNGMDPVSFIRCGTLTLAELEQALRSQADSPGQSLRPIGEVLVEQNMVPPTMVEAALEKQRQVKEGKGGSGNLIRVDAGKLDQLINLIGELIIAGAGASLIARCAGHAELLEATSTMSRLIEEVRDSALKLRMVQIGSTFNRFNRVVHDVSKELGKEIELVISGAETDLDKTVVERIGDPLMHLVRNAMDHGIEPADVRLARGKPARGTLHLNAYHDSGSIVIEVSDDGGGLSKEKILKKAIVRGMVSENDNLGDQEIYNLVFEPGFSTADQVSNLSGRGVGMDVVRRNIAALRGSVDLDTEEGQGTTVRIRLPLTLAIIDGFLVAVGKASFVIPLDLVVECLELAPEDRRAASERNYISLRGQVLPYINLREMFDVEGERARRENLVVVRHGSARIGLVVDYLLGEIQTVIKPLGRIFSHVNGIAGSTILGNGEVALILDIPMLARQMSPAEEKRMVEAREICSGEPAQ